MKSEKGATQLIVFIEVILILTIVLFGLVIWSEVDATNSKEETTTTVTTEVQETTTNTETVNEIMLEE